MGELNCQSSPPRYLRLLLQLLPPGLAWQWGERSAGRHLLAAIAEEFHRAHQFFCQLIVASIERFESEHQGWSCADYERLLVTKFGIDATVTDHVCDPLSVDNADADSLVYGERFVYLIEITVDALDSAFIPHTQIDQAQPASDLYERDWQVRTLSAGQQQAADYLEAYKQSHTVFCWRDRSIGHETAYDIDAITVDNADAASALYEQAYNKLLLWVHPSWKQHEFSQLSGWEAIPPLLKPHTKLERKYAFH